MTPMLAIYNRTYGRFRNAILVCQSWYTTTLPSYVGTPNIAHRFFCQFTHAMTFATIIRCRSSFFLPRIPLVASIGSEEKMIGTNTRGIVAPMTNKQPFRDFPEMQSPRKSMSTNVAMLAGTGWHRKHSVAISASALFCARPLPASRCFLDVFPKPNLPRDSSFRNQLIAFLTTIFPRRVSCWGESLMAA